MSTTIEDVYPGWILLEWSGPTHNWKSPASPTFTRATEHWKIHPDSKKGFKRKSK